jgi:hypothetical protein
MSRTHRAAFAQFWCGVAPIRLETGRYERTPANERYCPFCPTKVEEEFHVISKCMLYDDLSKVLYAKALSVNGSLNTMTDVEQFVFLFSSLELIRLSAKTCFLILQRRSEYVYR